MTFTMDRRRFLAAAGAGLATAALPTGMLAGTADIKVGIDTDTRPDWNIVAGMGSLGPPHFLRGIREASEVGYHNIEIFWAYVSEWENKPDELMDIMAKLNLKFESITNQETPGMSIMFQDASLREEQLASHTKLLQFNKKVGADHLKLNCGLSFGRKHIDTVEMYQNMATTIGEIAKRGADMGIPVGFHPHVGSFVERQQDVDKMLELTDPRYVHLVLDTGQVTMGGMDPVELTHKYLDRIIEFHIKDTARNAHGGYRGDPDELDTISGVNIGTNRVYYEAGQGGGVDFPAIMAILNQNNWKGWFTVELERSENAKLSAAMSKMYLEQVLKVKF